MNAETILDGNADAIGRETYRFDSKTTAIVLTACFLILVPTVTYRMGVDQGVFAYMGAEILEGRWPYLDTWESDFPGLMFLQAVEILLLGKSIAMFRMFDIAFQLANAYLICRITSRVSGFPGAYLAAMIFCLIYQSYGPWNTAQREGFGLFFVLIGFWLFLTSDRRNTLVTAAAIGLGFGIAVSIKPTLLALTALYLPLLVRVNRKTWTLFILGMVGLVVPTVAILTFYWMHDGLVQIYEACIAYQSIYTLRLRGDEPALFYWLSKLQRLGGHAVLLPMIYAPFLSWGPARRERFMLFLGYLGSVWMVFVQGTFAGYHYLPGLAFGSILVGNMFSQVTTRVLRDSRIRIGAVQISSASLVAILLIVSALPFYVRPEPIKRLLTRRFLDQPLPNEFRNGTVFDFTEDFQVATHLREHTRPGDRIQVWGYESLVYYLADRDAASRFQMTHPLVMRVPGQDITPMQRRWRHEFMDDMLQNQPRYVAVVREDNWWWAPQEKTSIELLDDFPEWKSYINDNYALEHSIGRFLVYRLVSSRQTNRGQNSEENSMKLGEDSLGE